MEYITNSIGKLWYRKGQEQKELLCFDSEQSGVLHTSEDYLDYNFKINGNQMTVQVPEKSELNCDYTFEFKDDTLVIGGDTQSALSGEWSLMEDVHDAPLEAFQVASSASFSATNDINTKCWMSKLPDSLSLKNICIPGTHDSAAYKMQRKVGTLSVLAQRRNFRQQLEDGIRSFDLRLSEGLNFFHGRYYLDQGFNSCLETFINFLNEYPGETIIITVKTENCDDHNKFLNRFNSVLDSNQSYFYTGTWIPSLGQVRRKIVLLRRYSSPEKRGVDMTGWRDDTTFTVKDSNGLVIKVQDRYKASMLKKVEYLESDFSNVYKEPAFMYISYFSISDPVIRNVANALQEKFKRKDVWKDLLKRRYFGIYPLDWYHGDLCMRLIQTNFV